MPLLTSKDKQKIQKLSNIKSELNILQYRYGKIRHPDFYNFISITSHVDLFCHFDIRI